VLSPSIDFILLEDAMSRLVELDGLRALVFGLLIFYHVGMLYVLGWDYHYKSAYSSETLANFMLWSNQWRMSLLFFISGCATAFLLARDASWQFVRKRVPLLLLPLLFGMLVTVVPQVYVEANSKHIIDCPDFWYFWYIYLDQHSAEFAQHKTLGSMHLTWNHLWFLPYLLAYSLIIWGLYPLLRTTPCRALWKKSTQHLQMWHIVLLPIVGNYLIGFFLYANHPTTHNFVDDWWNHARSFLFFLVGFALVQLPRLWQDLLTWCWHFLIAGLCSYAYCLFSFHGGNLGSAFFAKELSSFIWSANAWLWMLSVIAWAQYSFKRSTPLLRYLNGGVFCFYVLHQTLIIVFAYWLTPFKLGPMLEPAAIIVLVGLWCVALYELIRRLPILPIFFGITKKS
jgi:glucan biosynthesis protein C